jgi:hypothetical protein
MIFLQRIVKIKGSADLEETYISCVERTKRCVRIDVFIWVDSLQKTLLF